MWLRATMRLQCATSACCALETRELWPGRLLISLQVGAVALMVVARLHVCEGAISGGSRASASRSVVIMLLSMFVQVKWWDCACSCVELWPK